MYYLGGQPFAADVAPVECSMRLRDSARPSRARLGSQWRHPVGRCYYRYRGAVLVGIILESSRATQNVLGGTPKILVPRCYKGEWFWGSRRNQCFENATP